ncbi:hypothetical protein EKN56_03130 [Limnobaculum zhutongyuii]|uniref:Uncharacterized protein n=1 Tax=Limnobaculum zhutongyuii TaxID=2498113 RepID=A0A411WHC5_9GAMM|nr:hypothetical protein [Limnobaculum zhutongyuii]QBH95486.1 hypothetical protein EKN56_03130 [Limnobaculum zhutongyuii]TQS88825.1 hypothetical protein ELQ32_09465 [Limnobaculum zhutongyuii]
MITKEKWTEIEAELRYDFARVTFKLHDHLIEVFRQYAGEGRTDLNVYVDGKISFAWMRADNAMHPLITQIWGAESKAKYSTKFIKSVEKIWGKRAAKKDYPDLRDRIVFYVPRFKKASVLVRKYKKIAGLELISIGGAVYD